MKAKLFFADKYVLTQTPKRDKSALWLIKLLSESAEFARGKPIVGKRLCEHMGFKDGAQLRLIVLYARTNLPRLIEGQTDLFANGKFAIIANSRGYWASDDPAEIRNYRDALHVRAVHGIMAVQAMNELLNEADYTDERAD